MAFYVRLDGNIHENVRIITFSLFFSEQDLWKGFTIKMVSMLYYDLLKFWKELFCLPHTIQIQ
jgi:hypothetical protein